MTLRSIRLNDEAHGLPYHAAYVPVSDDRAPLHRHQDYCEILYVVSGSGWHRLNVGEQPLREGDVVLVRQTDTHTFAASRSTPMAFINIAFPTGAWRSFLALSGVDDVPVSVQLSGAERDEARGVFTRALEAFGRGPSSFDLVQFWTGVIPLLGYPSDTPDPSQPPWLRQMCVAMETEEHLREGLPRMLSLAAVSHGYLARCMRDSYGITPVAFLTELRMRHAAALLRSTPASIADIAQRCGFSTQSYFSRLFRRTYGLTPRDFRERARHALVPR